MKVVNREKPGVKQTQPYLQCDSRNKHLILIIWLVRANLLRCSGNRNLIYKNEHEVSPCSIQANVSIQQQIVQVVSCHKLSSF